MLTEDILKGCVRPIRFPLERMSGIKSRHVAESEFSIDLAKRAIVRCLATSRYGPHDVDLVICASVARCDGPGLWVSYEPSTALRLRKHFGFDNAMAFDIASACTGMFTAINIIDALLHVGAIECGLVVSGEYVSHLATTAQQEIEGLLDPRLACLTLGDAGAAVMLAEASTANVGFDALDLYTVGSCARYCTAGPTDQAHGGGIMFTDALALTDAATRHGSSHALATLERAQWSRDSFQHLIMHQTSRTGLASATREINRLLKGPVCHPGNTIDNLGRRGNTASTTHFVALADNILNNRIRSGDRLIFAISGSGLTVGTALYTLDDLPDRLGGAPATSGARRPADSAPTRSPRPAGTPRVRIESVGTVRPDGPLRNDSLTLLRLAATDCLSRSSYRANDIGLLIYAGTYRSQFISEPAIAALLAGDMDINATITSPNGKRTLAFDVSNGAAGLLYASYVAGQMIRAMKATTAMVVTADVENNGEWFPEELLGIQEVGSALILDAASGDASGFGNFLFRSFTAHADAFTSYCTNRDGRVYLAISRDPDLERHYVASIVSAVGDLLSIEGLELSQIKRIFPPQISSLFISELSRALNVAPDRCVDVVRGGLDLFTSAIPFAIQCGLEQDLVRAGDIGLIISVGSGIQVGCAIYYF